MLCSNRPGGEKMDIATVLQIAKTKAGVNETNQLLKEQNKLLREIRDLLMVKI